MEDIMKKSICSFFLASVIATFGLSSIFAENVQIQAVVTKTKGKTEIQDSASVGKWSPLSVGSTIKKGDVIQTGFKSELELEIKGTKVIVAPLSRITVEQLVAKEGKDETSLFLDTGSVKSSVKKTEDRAVGFKVRSPVATASVRGTVLEVKNGFRTTNVTTHEGVVAVWQSKNKVSVATEKEDQAPAVLPTKGNSPQNIYDGAPKTAFTVTKEQTTDLAENGSITSTKTNATKKAFAFKTEATQKASSLETVSSTSSSSTELSVMTVGDAATATATTVKKGTISVSPTW